ncbi:MAG: hypothetical protein OEV59_00750 [Deltaproteobacteria bacterium]|nr:hypothetical protein [Deltaproteobacteria bacterium]
MAFFKNDSGESNRSLLVWILIVGLIGYCGYLVGVPEVTSKMLKADMEDEVENAHHYDDEEIRKHLMESIAKWELPIKREQIQVTRDNDYIDIRIKYSVNVSFLGAYEKRFDYNLASRKRIQKT